MQLLALLFVDDRALRLHRRHPDKRDVWIFDYVDREEPMLLRMFERRLRGYRAIGYARGETPLGYGESSDERPGAGATDPTDLDPQSDFG